MSRETSSSAVANFRAQHGLGRTKTNGANFYQASPIKSGKRVRRSGAQMISLLEAIKTILDGEPEQITIRHLFYRLVGLGQIPKTEGAYQSLCGHLSKWRRSGDVAWDAFADNTRWHLGTETFDGLNDALANTVQCYRRNLWAQQSAHVEIWGEKDAISGILYSEADTFGVKVFTCRGFASLSALYSAANTFKRAVAAGKKFSFTILATTIHPAWRLTAPPWIHSVMILVSKWN